MRKGRRGTSRAIGRQIIAVKIEGTCDPKFDRVKDAFAENFELRSEVGAAVAVTLDGKSVVDLWAGYADKAKTRPWTRDELVNVYSTTKGVTAICAHRLADQGKLDFDAPVEVLARVRASGQGKDAGALSDES